LDEGTVVAFLDGSLSAAARGHAESHIASCRTCCELTTWAAADRANQSRPPGSEGRPFVGQLVPGSRVERYQVLAAIGRGGMGEVYAAYHPDLDRRIALKVVNEFGADAPERRARLLREARAIARLSHPNVVVVYDAGTMADRVYIAMEFVAGETVEAWLKSGKRAWSEVLDVFLAAGRGLAAAHAAGVVHRDFKPQNVMVGRDGSVRVMDFGLARLAEEPVEAGSAVGSDSDRNAHPLTVTKTGALLGTLAYMAPEQFARQAIDARADQFSFCVALYEALSGSRPALAHLSTQDAGPRDDRSASSRPSGIPGWLRSTIARGLSPDREQRFVSMDALLSSVNRTRTHVRRRVSALGIAFAAVLLSLGGWRLASARRISCAVPRDRLAGAWIAGDDASPRRQAIHRAFTATARPTAETSWQRVSKVLDDYIQQWSTMYVQTCEATHVRGEQSADLLDLRMSCLSDSLDQVRAVTNVLAAADAQTIAQATKAALALTPIGRCADVELLRSAVPLPRDGRVLEAVRQLKRSLSEIQALVDVGNLEMAHDRAVALRPAVAATGYRPLLAQLLEVIGNAEARLLDPARGEATLREAVFVAESSRDDQTAAKAAADIIFVVGYRMGRVQDADLWAHLANAILDRIGVGTERARAWVFNNHATALAEHGDLEGARALTERAISLKEEALGKDHPDVGVSLHNLSLILSELRRYPDALVAASRSIGILKRYGDPETCLLANAYQGQGTALFSLGRYQEAEVAFVEAVRIFRRNPGLASIDLADALQGLADVRIIQARPADAIPLLNETLAIRESQRRRPVRLAETRFALARALWEGRGDRRRAVSLANQAHADFASPSTPMRERDVARWLAVHKS
jgi:eukaryotic-like serine/threonine-protein kinase